MAQFSQLLLQHLNSSLLKQKIILTTGQLPEKPFPDSSLQPNNPQHIQIILNVEQSTSSPGFTELLRWIHNSSPSTMNVVFKVVSSGNKLSKSHFCETPKLTLSSLLSLVGPQLKLVGLDLHGRDDNMPVLNIVS